MNEELDKLGRPGAELVPRAKGDAPNIQIAQRLRAGKSGSLKWSAAQLQMGTWTQVGHRSQNAKHENRPNDEGEFEFV